MSRIEKCGGREPPLFAVRETDAGVVGVTIRVVATAVAATTDRMASASMSDFAVAVTAVNVGNVGGRRRRTVVQVVVGVVLPRAVGDVGGCVRRFWGLVAEGVCGVFMPWVHGRWVLGLGVCRAMRQ